MSYKEVYAGWQADPEAFWMKAAEAIDWIKAPSKALWNDDAPLYEWFKDAQHPRRSLGVLLHPHPQTIA